MCSMFQNQRKLVHSHTVLKFVHIYKTHPLKFSSQKIHFNFFHHSQITLSPQFHHNLLHQTLYRRPYRSSTTLAAVSQPQKSQKLALIFRKKQIASLINAANAAISPMSYGGVLNYTKTTSPLTDY